MVAQRLCQRQASVPSVLCSEVVQWVACEVGLRREGGGKAADSREFCAYLKSVRCRDFADVNGDRLIIQRGR